MESVRKPDAAAKAWSCWPELRARREAQDTMGEGRRKASGVEVGEGGEDVGEVLGESEGEEGGVGKVGGEGEGE